MFQETNNGKNHDRMNILNVPTTTETTRHTLLLQTLGFLERPIRGEGGVKAGFHPCLVLGIWHLAGVQAVPPLWNAYTGGPAHLGEKAPQHPGVFVCGSDWWPGELNSPIVRPHSYLFQASEKVGLCLQVELPGAHTCMCASACLCGSAVMDMLWWVHHLYA